MERFRNCLDFNTFFYLFAIAVPFLLYYIQWKKFLNLK